MLHVPIDADAVDDDWRAPALAALPLLEEDLVKWESLPEERRRKTIAVAFATATLLDDARLLLRAIDQESELATEFSFLNEVRNPQKPPITGSSMDAAVRSINEALDDPQVTLRERALVLRDAASDLAEGCATEEKFYSLEQCYGEVLELRESILAQADADAVENQIGRLAAHLQEVAATVPWLEEELDQVISAWRDVCRKTADVEPEQVRAGIERAISELPDALAAVTAAQADEDAARKERNSHESAVSAKPPRSRAERQQQVAVSDELVAALSEASQVVGNAMDRALDVLKPRLDGVQPDAGASSGTNRSKSDSEIIDAGPKSQEGALDSTASSSVRPTPDTERPATPEPISDTQPEGEDIPREPGADHPAHSTMDGAPKRTDEQSLGEPADEVNKPTGNGGVSPDPASAGAEDAETADEAPASIPTTAANDKVDMSPAQDAIWRALDVGRVGLAYQIAHLDQQLGGGRFTAFA